MTHLYEKKRQKEKVIKPSYYGVYSLVSNLLPMQTAISPKQYILNLASIGTKDKQSDAPVKKHMANIKLDYKYNKTRIVAFDTKNKANQRLKLKNIGCTRHKTNTW